MKSICYLYVKPKRNHKHPNQFCVNNVAICTSIVFRCIFCFDIHSLYFIIITCNFCIYYGNIYVLSYYFVIVFFSSMFILNVVYHHLWYVILFYRLNTYNRVCKSIAHKQLCFYLIDFLNAISIPQSWVSN